MNYTAQAIKHSMEGGYLFGITNPDIKTFWCESHDAAEMQYKNEEHERISGHDWKMPVCNGIVPFLDPLFWQSLGKSLGWERTFLRFHDDGTDETMGEWWRRWHEFIDHLADGKDAESYFKEIFASHEA